jgi:hypothetical protein
MKRIILGSLLIIASMGVSATECGGCGYTINSGKHTHAYQPHSHKHPFSKAAHHHNDLIKTAKNTKRIRRIRGNLRERIMITDNID